MSISLILPGIAAVLVAVAAGFMRWSIAPRTAMRVLTAVAALTSTTVFVVAATTAGGLVGRSGIGLAILERCPRLSAHHQVGTLEGLLSVVALGFMVFRMCRVVRVRRWAVSGTKGRHLAILDTDEPIAYAAPGKPGCVVVSRGLLRELDSNERRVLFAHERAHLAQNHHRYLLVGALAHAVVPVLGRLVRQIQLATERCADEVAVAATGGDREAVAATIGRAALATAAFGGTLGAFGGGSIPVRVEALLGEPDRSVVTGLLFVAVAVAVGALAASSLQMHHLYGLAAHVCGQ
jgi:Zn-dependent protease with chaperone function